MRWSSLWQWANMVSTHDARYILGEIRNIQYYETRIAELNLKLAEISEQIQDASAPRSPNGGHDVMVNGRTVRIRIHGGEYDSGSAVTALITRQKPIEADLNIIFCILFYKIRSLLDGKPEVLHDINHNF